MCRKSNIFRISWFAILFLALPILHVAMRVKPADPLPNDWILPETYDGWVGERLYYSTDPEVTRAFRESDLIEAGVCPQSGAPLDDVSVAERRLLPADVEIERRLYHRSNGDYRHVIMLVTGASREGIHRPEWCLSAQGVRIGSLRFVDVDIPGGKRITVATYPMYGKHASDATQAQANQFFVYWFEGQHGHLTAYNWKRILKMGWDRLWNGKVQRWAYFSIQMNRPRGVMNADAAIADAVNWFLRGRAHMANVSTPQ